MDYTEFLHSKIEIAKETGFDVSPDDINAKERKLWTN